MRRTVIKVTWRILNIIEYGSSGTVIEQSAVGAGFVYEEGKSYIPEHNHQTDSNKRTEKS